jgi:hypothetical protein
MASQRLVITALRRCGSVNFLRGLLQCAERSAITVHDAQQYGESGNRRETKALDDRVAYKCRLNPT